MSAVVIEDFEERRNADEYRFTFLRGEKVKNCSVRVNDDSVFEPEEEFQVHLETPQGDHWSGAMVGSRDIVTVTIANDEDGENPRQQITGGEVQFLPFECKVLNHGVESTLL
ncbi:extracellular matrix organizing protein FRAS1-like [Pungitius pungitius]|uniref:extracellular matrix organizing protein FRAS1-like n=1 Tax=Pungitius pungitius TaxID=134920 RepID=UPI002E100859